jgi:hypothetical protein
LYTFSTGDGPGRRHVIGGLVRSSRHGLKL